MIKVITYLNYNIMYMSFNQTDFHLYLPCVTFFSSFSTSSLTRSCTFTSVIASFIGSNCRLTIDLIYSSTTPPGLSQQLGCPLTKQTPNITNSRPTGRLETDAIELSMV